MAGIPVRSHHLSGLSEGQRLRVNSVTTTNTSIETMWPPLSRVRGGMHHLCAFNAEFQPACASQVRERCLECSGAARFERLTGLLLLPPIHTPDARLPGCPVSVDKNREGRIFKTRLINLIPVRGRLSGRFGRRICVWLQDLWNLEES